MSSQALPRSFQDTYNMWVRDTKSTGGDFGGAGAGGSW